MQLQAQSLVCERGGRIVFQDLSFAVDGGAAFVVTGPNGIGKSSLLRLIAGLTPLTSGSLVLEGGDADKTIAAQCHYFGHQDALKPALTVEENLTFWRQYYGPGGNDVSQALEVVSLAPISHLPAAYLSAGQRRRLALARLLVSDRPIWLLDEPTSALDAASAATFVDLANRHLKGGGLIVVATHGPLELINQRPFEMGRVAA